MVCLYKHRHELQVKISGIFFQDTISCIPVFPLICPCKLVHTSTITQDVSKYFEFRKEVGIAIESKETSNFLVRNS